MEPWGSPTDQWDHQRLLVLFHEYDLIQPKPVYLMPAVYLVISGFQRMNPTDCGDACPPPSGQNCYLNIWPRGRKFIIRGSLSAGA